MAETEAVALMSHTDVRRAALLIERRNRIQHTLDGIKTIQTIDGLNNASVAMSRGGIHIQKASVASILRDLDIEERFGNRMVEVLITVAAEKIGEINFELKNLGVAT